MTPSHPQADPDPDLAILLTGAARVVTDRLGKAVADAGIDDMRSVYGFVIRALADVDRTLTEVAELLAVSKQAAIKVIDEMERRGFLIREEHPTDRRVKLLRLTAKGRKVRRAALAESHRMEAELIATVGPATAKAVRHGLLTLLEENGGVEQARAGRSRALW